MLLIENLKRLASAGIKTGSSAPAAADWFTMTTEIPVDPGALIKDPR